MTGMSSSKSMPNITDLVSAITAYVADFINRQPDEDGAINLEATIEAWKDDGEQENIRNIILNNLPTRTRLKDPDAPKRPLSAYMLFCGDHRASNPEKSWPVKELATLWAGLSDSDKARFVTKASKEKEKYNKAKESYERKCERKYGEGITRPPDDVLAKLEINNKPKRKRRSTTKPKKAKIPGAPKGKSNAYIFFAKDMRSKVKEKYPDLDAKGVTSKLAELWKTKFKSDSKRKKWVELAAKDKIRYDEEKAKFDAEHGGDGDESGNESGDGEEQNGSEKADDAWGSSAETEDGKEEEKPKKSSRPLPPALSSNSNRVATRSKTKTSKKVAVKEPEPESDDEDVEEFLKSDDDE